MLLESEDVVTTDCPNPTLQNFNVSITREQSMRLSRRKLFSGNHRALRSLEELKTSASVVIKVPHQLIL